MESSDMFNQDYTKTDINGLPAKYVLAKHPSDPEGGYVVAKVIDVANPPRPPINPLYNFNTTPEHLTDPSKFIIQHRLGDHSLPYRRIDPELYTDEEKNWYTTGILSRPIRAVMIYQLKCYCCGDFQISDDDIHWESIDVENRLGYKYCSNCKPYFRQAMFKTLAPIWVFRLKYEEWRDQNNVNLEKPFIWVHRTRRDAEGKRDVLGNSPYKYTKWRVLSWVTVKHDMPHPNHDGTSVVDDPEDCITIEQISEIIVNGGEYYTLTKLVSVMDVLITNQGMLDDPNNYDPNIDDPLNKYTHEEKVQIVREARRNAVLS
jgi:hypothetical protein